jgi:hypothetical protein
MYTYIVLFLLEKIFIFSVFFRVPERILCTTTVILSRFAFRIRNEVQAPSFGVLHYASRNITIHGVGDLHNNAITRFAEQDNYLGGFVKYFQHQALRYSWCVYHEM